MRCKAMVFHGAVSLCSDGATQGSDDPPSWQPTSLSISAIPDQADNWKLSRPWQWQPRLHFRSWGYGLYQENGFGVDLINGQIPQEQRYTLHFLVSAHLFLHITAMFTSQGMFGCLRFLSKNWALMAYYSFNSYCYAAYEWMNDCTYTSRAMADS